MNKLAASAISLMQATYKSNITLWEKSLASRAQGTPKEKMIRYIREIFIKKKPSFSVECLPE
jgi:hypothetical protein